MSKNKIVKIKMNKANTETQFELEAFQLGPKPTKTIDAANAATTATTANAANAATTAVNNVIITSNTKRIMYPLLFICGFLTLFTFNLFATNVVFFSNQSKVTTLDLFKYIYIIEVIGFIIQFVVPLINKSKHFLWHLNVILCSYLILLIFITTIELIYFFSLIPPNIYVFITLGFHAVVHVTGSFLASYIFLFMGNLSRYHIILYICGTNTTGIATTLCGILISTKYNILVLDMMTLILCLIAFVLGLIVLIKNPQKKFTTPAPTALTTSGTQTNTTTTNNGINKKKSSLQTMFNMMRHNYKFSLNLAFVTLSYTIFISCWPFVIFQTASTFLTLQQRIFFILLSANIAIFIGNFFTFFYQFGLNVYRTMIIAQLIVLFPYFLITYTMPLSANKFVFLGFNFINALIFGLSSSYFASRSHLFLKRKDLRRLASALTSFSIIIGLFLGTCFSCFFLKFLPIYNYAIFF